MARPRGLVQAGPHATGTNGHAARCVLKGVRQTKKSLMLNLILLVLAMNCSPSPVDPQGSVAGDGGLIPGPVEADTSWNGGIEVDLESFSSTEQLRADRSVFAVENLGLDHVFLDSDVAFTEGGLTRSMRYDWTDQGTKAISVGRGIRLPSPVPELWVEVAIRWSPNFTSCNPAKPPCDHKTLFLQVTPDMNGRWEVHFGGGAGETGPEANVTMGAASGRVEDDPDDSRWYLSDLPWPRPYVGANQYYDGQWHVIRLHAKHSTTEDTFDGRMRLWVDGQLLYDTRQLEQTHGSPRFSTRDGTAIHGILLGRNKDKGLDSGTESMWIGRVRAFKDDPGWQ